MTIVVTIERKNEAAEAKYSTQTLYSQVFEDETKLDINDLIMAMNSRVRVARVLDPKIATNHGPDNV